MNTYGGVEALFNAFLTSAPNGVLRFHTPVTLSLIKSPMVPPGRIGPRPGLHAMQKKNLLLLIGITPQFLSCPAHRLLLYYLGYPSSQHTSNITDLLLATSAVICITWQCCLLQATV
jgi:hypothetical protein